MEAEIPVVDSVDVIAVGGSSGAVEAALAAAEGGASVLCSSPYTYLGEDVCATARYWLDPDQAPATELAREVFSSVLAGGGVITPMQVKYPLEQSLVRDGIRFLYMTYPVCLLRDDEERIAGLVVVNRSGFQAIRAHTIIDATERALIGRMGRGEFRELKPGSQTFRRIVVGGEPTAVVGMTCRGLPGKIHVEEAEYSGFEVEFSQQMDDASPRAFGKAEVTLRRMSWHPDQKLASDRLACRLPDRLITDSPAEVWCGADQLPLGALQCGDDALYVLGGCADLSEAVAVELEKPCHLMKLGQRLGAHVAATLSERSIASTVAVQYRSDPVTEGDARRCDRYFRMEGAETLPFDLNRLPTLCGSDVVVAGGGTAGAPAGIAAARAGAQALVLEVLPNLGGVGTEGRIAQYYHGNRCGFTTEIDHGVHGMGPNPEFEWDNGNWNTEWKKQWYLAAASQAGCELWFGALTCGAIMVDGRVSGVIAATPYGLGLVSAGAVVDATGNADLAAAAGGEVVNISKAHVAVQGTGLAPVTPGKHYQNTDHTFVDDTDVMDVTRAFVMARQKFRDCFDLAQIIDSRQRQQVQGDLCLDPLDFLAGRTFPDTVVTVHRSRTR